VKEGTISFAGVSCIAATEMAIQCKIDGEKVWIPQSQVDDDSEVWKLGDHGTLVITQWIAKEKELI